MTRLFATVLMVPAVGLLMALALVLITGMAIIVCAADFLFDPGSLQWYSSPPGWRERSLQCESGKPTT